MTCYGFNGETSLVAFPDHVLTHFARYQQTTSERREAGGQLFTTFASTGPVTIQRATGPRWSDRRGRTFFAPNRWAERREIRRLFRRGQHFVGDWHTHPEDFPRPSNLDVASLQEIYRASRHDLASLVLVIVGTAELPSGLFVALVTANSVHELRVGTQRRRLNV